MAMRTAVTYTPYATSSKEKTGDVITFAQFEEGNLISETRNDTESDDKYDSESVMMSEKDMENIDGKEKFDDDLISTETLHDIRDGNQTHPNIDKMEARLEIRDSIKQKKLQWKGALRATHKMVKGLHRVFSAIVSEISQELTNFGESGSEVSHFIPEPRNFAEVTKSAENIIKPWLKATLKEIKNLINNQTFMIEYPKDGEPVTPCMDVYKAKIQSDGSLDKINFRIVVRGDSQNKEMIGDTWSPVPSLC